MAQNSANGRREKVFVMSMGDFFEDHPQVKPCHADVLLELANA